MRAEEVYTEVEAEAAAESDGDELEVEAEEHDGLQRPGFIEIFGHQSNLSDAVAGWTRSWTECWLDDVSTGPGWEHSSIAALMERVKKRRDVYG